MALMGTRSTPSENGVTQTQVGRLFGCWDPYPCAGAHGAPLACAVACVRRKGFSLLGPDMVERASGRYQSACAALWYSPSYLPVPVVPWSGLRHMIATPAAPRTEGAISMATSPMFVGP